MPLKPKKQVNIKNNLKPAKETVANSSSSSSSSST